MSNPLNVVTYHHHEPKIVQLLPATGVKANWKDGEEILSEPVGMWGLQDNGEIVGLYFDAECGCWWNPSEDDNFIGYTVVV